MFGYACRDKREGTNEKGWFSAVIEKPFFSFSRQLMERHDERIVTHVFLTNILDFDIQSYKDQL